MNLGFVVSSFDDHIFKLDFEYFDCLIYIIYAQGEGYFFVAFSYFDKDGSGYITLDELQQACKEIRLILPDEKYYKGLWSSRTILCKDGSRTFTKLQLNVMAPVNQQVRFEFRKCLRHIFRRDEQGFLNMCFDATIEIVTTKGVKICGVIGPCVSLHKKNVSVSDKEVGEGGTNTWKLGTITDKTCIAFFLQVSEEQRPQPGAAFFIQFIKKYRHGNMGIRKRVMLAARRWVSGGAPEIAVGFDQETAGAVMARLAVHETGKNFP
ncbi:putative protein transport protein Sec23 [Helianthus annuus]|nr:putative protein transport protein Sec23 [Helianthus annuus]